ncbi:MAG: cation:dicarboxylase symporter family transporter [Proteobacteria bacterium]|nr:cation:dicarboxylase symporter family transporter [Pseudomonadota bacterium]
MKHAARTQLWMKVLIGLLLGCLTGLLLGPAFDYLIPTALNTAITSVHETWAFAPEHLSVQIGHWLALPGYIFLAVLQMVVIPLIFSSVVRGIADSKNPAMVKKVGLRVLAYFVVTTCIAIGIGLTLVSIIQPGDYMDKMAVKEAVTSGSKYVPPLVNAHVDNLPKEITTILPRNIIKTMAEGDMLKIVIFAGFFGLALLGMPRSTSRPLIDLSISLQEACMVVVGWVLRLAPMAVFGLIAEVTAQVGAGALLGMAAYMGTVILGLLCILAFYMCMVRAVGRKVGEFFRTIREAQLVAFSTSSSAATMPVTMRIAQEKLGLRPSIPQLVIPLGTTVNMDGTAVYQTIAAVFLAQVTGIDISMSGYLLIILTALGASIGAPGMPGVGVVILSTILHGIGVDAGYIALIIGVDRILDMCRTTINVTGDLVASTVMDKLLGRNLQEELSDVLDEVVAEVKEVVSPNKS